MSEYTRSDKQARLNDKLGLPRYRWGSSLAERDSDVLKVYRRRRTILPGDSVTRYEPIPKTAAELAAEYSRLYTPGHGASDLAVDLRESGRIEEISELTKVGGAVITICTHMQNMDPAILSDAFAQAFDDPEMIENTNIIIGPGMENLKFLGRLIPDILRSRGRVLVTAPDTPNGHTFLDDETFDELSTEFAKEHWTVVGQGGLTVANLSGTIDKEQDDGRVMMQRVPRAGITLARNYDRALPVALVSNRTEQGQISINWHFGKLVKIPKGRGVSKDRSATFVHRQMGKVADWATGLTSGEPEVYYESEKQAARRIGTTD